MKILKKTIFKFNEKIKNVVDNGKRNLVKIFVKLAVLKMIVNYFAKITYGNT